MLCEPSWFCPPSAVSPLQYAQWGGRLWSGETLLTVGLVRGRLWVIRTVGWGEEALVWILCWGGTMGFEAKAPTLRFCCLICNWSSNKQSGAVIAGLQLVFRFSRWVMHFFMLSGGSNALSFWSSTASIKTLREATSKFMAFTCKKVYNTMKYSPF